MFETHFSKFQINSGNIYYLKDITIPKAFYPNLPYILRVLLYRQKMNMNTFVLIVGNPRSSKSYCAMKIAEEYCAIRKIPFDIEKQLTFDDVKKFLVWSQTATDSIFILDETGTTLSPDLFWSLQQRVMRKFCQVGGFRKNILIWVLPSIIFIQKGFRFLTNYALMTKKQGLVEVYKIVVNQLIGKGYPDRIETMEFGLPSSHLIEKYEALKRKWNAEDLKKDIEWLDEIAKPTEKILPIPAIINLVKNKVVDREFAKEELMKHGYSYGKADLFLESEIPS